MGGGAGRSAKWQGVLHVLRVLGCPLKSLTPPHGPSIDKQQLLNAKNVFEQFLLTRHVVIKCDQRKVSPVGRCWRIGGRGGKAVAKHIDGDDEVFFWIDCTAGAEKGFVSNVGAGIKGREQDDIASIRIR